jgi:hypothetical protein
MSLAVCSERIVSTDYKKRDGRKNLELGGNLEKKKERSGKAARNFEVTYKPFPTVILSEVEASAERSRRTPAPPRSAGTCPYFSPNTFSALEEHSRSSIKQESS